MYVCTYTNKQTNKKQDVGYRLLESYVQHLQQLCYEETTKLLMEQIPSDEDEENEKQEETNAATLQTAVKNGQSNPSIQQLRKQQKEKEKRVKNVQLDRRRHEWMSLFPYATASLPKWLALEETSVPEASNGNL
ncbi:hypothetical protein RFI_24442 [Reticulomyxa filosa]|uniref:Uncharacterized protein n=1 Tax=Reticulomyxa filosa TaxID=46433 RepID=X6MH26_RETFI|nr:hypothetical protein RFI_24442 [Reticulomyxa filosa]|eukprot:ETO12936.1 hypothetical protein RFI_24442 [Reticulomyxa filosa]